MEGESSACYCCQRWNLYEGICWPTPPVSSLKPQLCLGLCCFHLVVLLACIFLFISDDNIGTDNSWQEGRRSGRGGTTEEIYLVKGAGRILPFLWVCLQWNGNVEWAAWRWASSLQYRQRGCYTNGGVAFLQHGSAKHPSASKSINVAGSTKCHSAHLLRTTPDRFVW